MKKVLAIAIVVLGFPASACAIDIKAITAKPTAGNPQFDNKGAWPDLVGDEYFIKEKRAPARLLIWGHVGENSGRGKSWDPRVAANWTDAATGKPAETPPDMDTEIENVRFDDLHRGGIVLPDRAIMEKWKNVSFGNGCLSRDPEELTRENKGKVFRGQPAEPLMAEKKYIAP